MARPLFALTACADRKRGDDFCVVGVLLASTSFVLLARIIAPNSSSHPTHSEAYHGTQFASTISESHMSSQLQAKEMCAGLCFRITFIAPMYL